jgi:serine/threonine-protein kinase HipA
MGRLSKTKVLSIWMNGEHVGQWRRTSGGTQEFMYAESWLTSRNARPISLSLPLRPSREPYRDGVGEFFDNLLPDNRQIRERIQRRFQTATTGAFDLLAEIGRDCVGAMQLVPDGQAPQDVKCITAESLSATGVADLLGNQLVDPLYHELRQDDTFRISLAGAQEKTALLFHEGVWKKPRQTTPTTHILKLPIGIGPQGIDLSTSVENEWLCAQIVKAYGLPAANCRIEVFGEYKVLVVERFDRRLAPQGNWYLRLPQEDFCQATATSPGLKYENEGGPGISRIMEILLGSERAEQDRRDFMRSQLIFWLLAAIDGHAKNFSIFLLPRGSYQLTPRYDILSVYPMLGHGHGEIPPEKIKMAMALHGKNKHYRWGEICGRHFMETAQRCGLAGMKTIMDEVIGKTPAVIDQVRSCISPQFPSQIADAILDGVCKQTEFLKNELTVA